MSTLKSVVDNNNKENITSLQSNIIINNAIIDSMSSNTHIQKDNSMLITNTPLQTQRMLSFSRRNSSTSTSSVNPQIKKRNSMCTINKSLLTDIKEIYENNINMCKDIMDNHLLLSNTRHILDEPEKILDAPQLIDDYYLNLLDWGVSDVISIGLGEAVYLWNAKTSETTELTTSINHSNICSVSFMNNGICIAIGYSEGNVELWDIEKQEKIRTLNGHNGRVSSLSWNNYILSTGSKDGVILNNDVRIKSHTVHKLIEGHNKEVCALTWNCENSVLASGGNDNLVCLWDVKSTSHAVNVNDKHKHKSIWSLIENVDEHKCYEIQPQYMFTQHEAAVKALAWSPWTRGLLASGGGKKDHCIKYWNTENGTLINSYDTGSQVCCLKWNPHEKEIISSHGYSKNQITVWNYPKMNKVIDLIGHLNRVLYMAISPDGCKLVTGSADETLRFWNLNDNEVIKSRMNDTVNELLDFTGFMNIR